MPWRAEQASDQPRNGGHVTHDHARLLSGGKHAPVANAHPYVDLNDVQRHAVAAQSIEEYARSWLRGIVGTAHEERNAARDTTIPAMAGTGGGVGGRRASMGAVGWQMHGRMKIARDGA